MKEFTSAIETVEETDAREERIVALMEREGISRAEAEAKDGEEKFIPFMVDGRELHAYQPTDGQLAFMLASLGRGQSSDQRFAAIINIMLACLRDKDKDYLEGRLLSRGKNRLPLEVVEGIFEHLSTEWFRDDVSESRKTL